MEKSKWQWTKKAIWRAEDESLWGLFTLYQLWASHLKPLHNRTTVHLHTVYINEDTRIALQNILPCKGQTQVVSGLLSNGLTLEGQSHADPSIRIKMSAIHAGLPATPIYLISDM